MLKVCSLIGLFQKVKNLYLKMAFDWLIWEGQIIWQISSIVGQNMTIATFVFRTSYFTSYSLNTYTDNGQLQRSSKSASNILNQLFTVLLVENSIEIEKLTNADVRNVLMNLTLIGKYDI